MTDQGRPAGQKRDAELSERIRQFETRQKQGTGPNRAKLPAQGMALAGRVTTELVAGVVVGAFVGWALDRWLETAPLFMVVCFFIGSAAGMMNVWRAITGCGMAVGFVDEESSENGLDGDEDQKGGRG